MTLLFIIFKSSINNKKIKFVPESDSVAALLERILFKTDMVERLLYNTVDS